MFCDADQACRAMGAARRRSAEVVVSPPRLSFTVLRGGGGNDSFPAMIRSYSSLARKALKVGGSRLARLRRGLRPNHSSVDGEPTHSDLPERYLRLARRNWQQDRELTAYYNRVYRACYDREHLQSRAFINFGPGSFRHKCWRTADRLYDGKTWSEQRGRGYEMKIDIDWNLIENTRVDADDASIKAVYCSHLVEHGWDDNVRFFFGEVHRILAPGGVFRVTCPDTALGIQAMRLDDRYFFPRQGQRSTSFMLLEYSSLLTHPQNATRIDEDGVGPFFAEFEDVYEALNEASRLSDRALQDRIGAHVNWFTVPKLESFLKEAGFNRVFPSAYGQSICPVLRDVRYFDKTDPHMTCYVDAVKG